MGINNKGFPSEQEMELARIQEEIKRFNDKYHKNLYLTSTPTLGPLTVQALKTWLNEERDIGR